MGEAEARLGRPRRLPVPHPLPSDPQRLRREATSTPTPSFRGPSTEATSPTTLSARTRHWWRRRLDTTSTSACTGGLRPEAHRPRHRHQRRQQGPRPQQHQHHGEVLLQARRQGRGDDHGQGAVRRPPRTRAPGGVPRLLRGRPPPGVRIHQRRYGYRHRVSTPRR